MPPKGNRVLGTSGRQIKRNAAYVNLKQVMSTDQKSHTVVRMLACQKVAATQMPRDDVPLTVSRISLQAYRLHLAEEE